MMKAKLCMILFVTVFGSKEYENAENGAKTGETIEEKNTENSIVVKIEESECIEKPPTSEHIGVTYTGKKWRVQRWSKNVQNTVHYGNFDNEETAAHASDTLAKKLMKNGEQGHKLNFPGDDTEVHKKQTSSEYIGVIYCKQKKSKWLAQRWGKDEKRMIYNGFYKNKEKAAHASDTLARELMDNGEHGHKLNYPDNHTEVHPKKKLHKYIGVNYDKKTSKWRASRWSKEESRSVYNGYYDNEDEAAHASDSLAKKLMDNGEQRHKLNFSDDPESDRYQKKKRKRQEMTILETTPLTDFRTVKVQTCE